MHGSNQELPVAVDVDGIVIRTVDWGGMSVSFESFPAGVDSAPVFVGLPDDRCQCPHWGIVLKGRVRVRYADRDEVYTAGDAFYMEPGHTTYFEDDTETVQFSPVEEIRTSNEVMARNLAAMQSAPAG